MRKMDEVKKRNLIDQITGAPPVSPAEIAECIWMADGESTLGRAVNEIATKLSEKKCATTADALKEIRGFLLTYPKEVLEEFDSIINAVKK